MTLILHLGVVDLPYVDGETPRQQRARVRQAKQGKQPIHRSNAPAHRTTGDVAEILEAKYHIFEIFYELHEQEIADAFAQGMSDALDNLLAGAPLDQNPNGQAIEWIKTRFHQFIEQQEMDALGVPGVPTKAAQMGVNHRLKRKRGLPRPSFRDTGLYEQAFEAWIEGQS